MRQNLFFYSIAVRILPTCVLKMAATGLPYYVKCLRLKITVEKEAGESFFSLFFLIEMFFNGLTDSLFIGASEWFEFLATFEERESGHGFHLLGSGQIFQLVDIDLNNNLVKVVRFCGVSKKNFRGDNIFRRELTHLEDWKKSHH